MKQAAFTWMILPFMLVFIFQGVLFYKDSLVRKTVDVAIYEASKEASVIGHFNEDIYDKTRQMLVNAVHFNEDDIEMQGTEHLITRGNYLDVTISVPRGRIYVLPGLIDDGSTADKIIRTKRIMSEYIP